MKTTTKAPGNATVLNLQLGSISLHQAVPVTSIRAPRTSHSATISRQGRCTP
jgi:hypothetical protein